MNRKKLSGTSENDQKKPPARTTEAARKVPRPDTPARASTRAKKVPRTIPA